MQEYVKKFLEDKNISYKPHEHKAVFTCEEAAEHCKHVGGMQCKNLFLKNADAKDAKNPSEFYLVVLPASKRLNSNALAKKLGARKLRFASEVELCEVLGLTPGGVTPLGLINDSRKQTTLVIDESAWNADTVNFHPNTNTQSLELTREEFQKLVKAFDVKTIIERL